MDAPVSVESKSKPLAQPVLKWAGGKRRLVEQYAPHFEQEFANYHEPFFGGGALYFWLYNQGRLDNRQAYLSDINPHLVNFYRVLRVSPEPLLERLKEHQKKHDVEHYYETRAKKPRKDVTRAARLFYLNRTCFNGLYRENSKGQFNVPIGRYRNPRIHDPEGLMAASAALQNANFEQSSYKVVEERAKSGDLVYFDPPYHPLSTTSSFTSYSKTKFTSDDQAELAGCFRRLAEDGVQVRLSNSDTPLVRELYKDFRQIPIQAARAINSKANQRQKITELLILSE